MTGSDDPAKPAPMIPAATARAMRMADTIVGSTALARRLFARGEPSNAARMSASLVNRFVTLADPRPLTSLIASRLATEAEQTATPDLPLPTVPRLPAAAAGRFASPPELRRSPAHDAPSEPLLGDLAALGWGQSPSPPTPGAPPPVAQRSAEPPIQPAAPRSAVLPVARRAAPQNEGTTTASAAPGPAPSSSAADVRSIASDALVARTTELPAAPPTPDTPRSESVERSAAPPANSDSVERSTVAPATSAVSASAAQASEQPAPIARADVPPPATTSAATPSTGTSTAPQSALASDPPAVPPLSLAALRPPMLIQPMLDPLARMGIALPPASDGATPPGDSSVSAPEPLAQPLRRTPVVRRELDADLPPALPRQRVGTDDRPAVVPGGGPTTTPAIARVSQDVSPAQVASALPPVSETVEPGTVRSESVARREAADSVEQGVAEADGKAPQSPATEQSVAPHADSNPSPVARSADDEPATVAPRDTAQTELAAAPARPVVVRQPNAAIQPVNSAPVAPIQPASSGTIVPSVLPPTRPAPLVLANLLVRRHSAGRAEAAGHAMPLLRMSTADSPAMLRRSAATVSLPGQAATPAPTTAGAPAPGLRQAETIAGSPTPEVAQSEYRAPGASVSRAAETGASFGSLPLLARVAGTRSAALWGGAPLDGAIWQPALASSILARTAEESTVPELPSAQHAAWSSPGDEPAQGLDTPAAPGTLLEGGAGAEWQATALPLPFAAAQQTGTAPGAGPSLVSRRASETMQPAAAAPVWRVSVDTPDGWGVAGLQPTPGWGRLPPLSVARNAPVLQRLAEPQERGASYADTDTPLELARSPAAVLAQRDAEESVSRAAEQAPAPAAPAAEQGGQSAADVERLARQVYEYLRRRLLIDQERRGRPFYD